MQPSSLAAKEPWPGWAVLGLLLVLFGVLARTLHWTWPGVSANTLHGIGFAGIIWCGAAMPMRVSSWLLGLKVSYGRITAALLIWSTTFVIGVRAPSTGALIVFTSAGIYFLIQVFRMIFEPVLVEIPRSAGPLRFAMLNCPAWSILWELILQPCFPQFFRSYPAPRFHFDWDQIAVDAGSITVAFACCRLIAPFRFGAALHWLLARVPSRRRPAPS